MGKVTWEFAYVFTLAPSRQCINWGSRPTPHLVTTMKFCHSKTSKSIYGNDKNALS